MAYCHFKRVIGERVKWGLRKKNSLCKKNEYSSVLLNIGSYSWMGLFLCWRGSSECENSQERVNASICLHTVEQNTKVAIPSPLLSHHQYGNSNNWQKAPIGCRPFPQSGENSMFGICSYNRSQTRVATDSVLVSAHCLSDTQTKSFTYRRKL